MRICGRKLWGGKPMAKATKRKIVKGTVEMLADVLIWAAAFALIWVLLGCC